MNIHNETYCECCDTWIVRGWRWWLHSHTVNHQVNMALHDDNAEVMA